MIQCEANNININNSQKCKKKLGLISFKCKCGKSFCLDHRLPETHECTFDFKKIEKNNNQIIKCNPEKIKKI